ncbi:MAG: hypothetical protein KAS73_10125 [Candidatus Sabulitectum sp.]|nr:hypothetical protein [Candidatus Sabulitectum sp.]
MTKYGVLAGIIFVMFAFFGCGSDSAVEPIDSAVVDSVDYRCHPDTLEKWSEWAMRTDEGLWEDEADNSVNLELICTYGGESMMNPPFFKVNSMHLSGDTLFITDQAQEALICMDLEGTVLWQYGEAGEGPGHFTYMGPSDSGSDWIAVCNAFGGRVEILNRSGELQTIISINNPLDVIALSDTSLAILSKAESGGNLHIYNLPDSKLYSFGRPSWTHRGTRSNRDLSGLLLGDYLVVTSKFCNQLFFFDLANRTISYDFARMYPTSYQTTHDGMAWPVMGTPFLGPDSTLCVNLPTFNSNAEFRFNSTPFEEYSPVTIIDRYDLQGNYLDSFCIPIRGGGQCIYSSEYGLFVQQYQTSMIYRFRVS